MRGNSKKHATIFGLLTVGLLGTLASCGQETEPVVSSSPSSSIVSNSVDSTSDSESAQSSSEEASTPASSPSQTYSIEVQAPEGVRYELNATHASAGDMIVLTLLPDEGVVVTSVLVNGENAAIEDNTVSFAMPDEDVEIVIAVEEGYGIAMASDEGIEGYVVDGRKYAAEGDKVFLGYRNVRDGYGFVGFEAEAEDGKEVAIHKDESLRCYLIMPSSSVTITCKAVQIPSALEGIVEDYGTGFQLDSADDVGSRLELRADYNLTLYVEGWAKPVMEGTYEVVDADSLKAELANGGTLSVNLSTAGFAKVLFTWEGETDALLLATDESLLEKGGNAYLTDSRDLIYPVTIDGEDCFTYFSEDCETAHWKLEAVDDASGEKVSAFQAGSVYSLREDGKEVVAIQYVYGNAVSIAGAERGTYLSSGSDDLVLNGFNSVRYGEKTGSYVYDATQDLVTATFGQEQVLFLIDTEDKTYSVYDPSAVQDHFAGKTFQGSFTYVEEDGWTQYDYFITVAFSQQQGMVDSIRAEPDDSWNAWNASSYEFTDVAYDFDEGNMELTVHVRSDWGTEYPVIFDVDQTYRTLTMTTDFYILDQSEGTVLNLQ